MRIYYIGMYEAPTAQKISLLKTAHFAHYSIVGTWTYLRDPCKKCNYYWQRIVAPLLIQWEPSTEVIGDFSWDGPFGTKFVVTERVVDKMNLMGFDCLFSEVQYVRPDRKRNVVPFPYAGPRLRWCQPTAMVSLDMERSVVAVVSHCLECGDVRYTFRDNGIVIRKQEWKQKDIFRIATNGPDLAFVTEEGRRLIEEAGLTNIAFTDAGEIID